MLLAETDLTPLQKGACPTYVERGVEGRTNGSARVRTGSFPDIFPTSAKTSESFSPSVFRWTWEGTPFHICEKFYRRFFEDQSNTNVRPNRKLNNVGINRHRPVGNILAVLVLTFLTLTAAPARAQAIGPESSPTAPTALVVPAAPAAPSAPGDPVLTPLTSPIPPSFGLPDLSKRETFSSAMQIIILLTVLSLAPAILIMMTSFTRIIIVLSLLRQAMGTQQLPPNQILIGLSLFMTFLVMGPTWQKVNHDALQPYMSGAIEQPAALAAAVTPVREFMIGQIRKNKNDADVLLFSEMAHEPSPKSWKDVGTFTLIPAYMLSELKTAFILGFEVYLPFLIIDMVISSVLISMGMMMLPPALISLPFKLLLFVLVDGWHLITGSLMKSFM